jgi:RNA polymerase sigma-70 factor (ECF subfamily)
VNDAIRQGYADGRRDYPEVEISFDVFERHCEMVLDAQGSSGWQRHGSDLFLACACAFGDTTAIAIFERNMLPAAAEAIGRVNDNPDFVKEALQTVSCRILVEPGLKIAEYSARGALVAWTKVVATRLALNQLGASRRLVTGRGELAQRLVHDHFEAETQVMKGRYSEVFQRALSDAVNTLPARERNVLRMHLVGRCSIDQIGRAYSVHRATAARWLSATKKRLFGSVRDKLRDLQPKLTDEEFKSVARLVQSQLDLTFATSSGAVISPLRPSIESSS